MLGKRFVYKRGVVIALAVVALMTLTAGVAAAAGAKAKFTASGDVGLVGLQAGSSTVESEFKTRKDGSIKSVVISTVGEGVFGTEGDMTMDTCTEKGKHSEGACDVTGAILNGGTVVSVHSSEAKLKVLAETPTALVGTLKGRLHANISLVGAINPDTLQPVDVLEGPGTLRIRSTDLTSTYVCLQPGPGAGPVPGIEVTLIASCMAATGPQVFGLGPVLVPIELHVIDTGRFDITSPYSGINMKGKLSVTVDSAGGVTSGEILVTKGTANIPHVHEDEDEDDDDHKGNGKGKKKGHAD